MWAISFYILLIPLQERPWAHSRLGRLKAGIQRIEEGILHLLDHRRCILDKHAPSSLPSSLIHLGFPVHFARWLPWCSHLFCCQSQGSGSGSSACSLPWILTLSSNVHRFIQWLVHPDVLVIFSCKTLNMLMVDRRKNLIPKIYTVSSIPILSENTLPEDELKVGNNCVLIN